MTASFSFLLGLIGFSQSGALPRTTLMLERKYYLTNLEDLCLASK